MGEKRPRSGKPGERVLSIVDRIEQKRMADLRIQSAKMHVREIEAAVEWLDMRKNLEGMDLDAEIARNAAGASAAAPDQVGTLRCLRGLQSCLKGDAAAGMAEWDAVEAETPDLALPHLFRARWIVQSDPKEALPHFDRAAELDPRDANVYWRRGDCYTKLGDHGRALANYRRALALDPHSIDGLYAMGKALTSLGQAEEALRYFDDAIARAPRYVDFYSSRAIVLEVLDKHEAAVRDYDRVLELDPTRGVAIYSRAQCLAALGQVDRAIEDLEKLAASDGDIHFIHLSLGKLHLKKERLPAARASLERAVELAPGEHEPRAYLGIALARSGEKERGLAEIERAIELAPERPEYVYVQLTVRHEGDVPAKIAALEDPIARFPDASMFLVERAELHERQGDHARSLEDWDRALATWPDDPDCHVGRARALASTERLEEAVDAASRAIELSPDLAVAHGMRAHYRHLAGGDDALIKADWRRALALAPDDAAARYYHAHYLESKDAHEAAILELDRVIALAPNFGEAYFDRGVARFMIDQPDDDDDDDWDDDVDPDAIDARVEATIADYERAIELGYRDEDVFVELHWAHKALDDKEAALAALDRGVAAHPTSVTLLTIRRLLRNELYDTDGAEDDRLRLLALGVTVPQDAPA